MPAAETKVFHESWYRIANERLCLRSSVRVHRQLYRGSRWYVLSDPFNNQFFRLRPEAHEFVIRLSPDRTVEEVWKETIEHDPENAPGQEEVIGLLAQLYQSNLLQYQAPPDSAKLFERYRDKKQRIVRSTLLNIMFFRIPLLDPDHFLKRLLPAVRLIINPVGGAIWLAVVLSALKVVAERFPELSVQSQGIIAPSNLFLLYIALVLVKVFHEFGHAFVVRRFGGEVHTMGVMFMLFSPIPYMDATAAWAFRSKWQRMLVGAAGMIAEVFVAALAVFVWANTGQSVINSLAYNMMFVASVSTVVFNINPLLRYDGYYILSDWLDIPNLHTKATQQLVHVIERYAFGYTRSSSPAATTREAVWLTVFGILSGLYKIVVFGSILFFIADRFLLAGIIMAVVCAIAWVAVPLIRLVRYLVSSPRLERVRARAAGVVAGSFVLVLGFLYFCPFPSSFKTSGVLKAAEYVVVANRTAGYLAGIDVAPGSWVKAGDQIMHLENRDLEYEIMQVKASLKEAYAMRLQALHNRTEDLKTIDSRIEAVTERLNRLNRDRDNLVIRAEVSGKWVAGDTVDYVGMWLRRGTSLGQIIDDREFYFASVVSQQDISRIFSDEVRRASVKLVGEADRRIPVSRFIRIPMEKTTLPSAALGWRAGGDIAVDPDDTQGVQTAEPFYEVRAYAGQPAASALLHGRTGKIRFELAYQPLLRQWWLGFRQLVQKRYSF